MTKDETTAVFHALASEHRRRILDLLKRRPGMAVGELAAEFDVTRIAVMNHIGVLERAGLLISEQDGRARRLYLNAVPIQMIHDRWTTHYTEQQARRLTEVKRLAETAMRSNEREDHGKRKRRQ